MPPKIWARYSPSPIRVRRSSVSPNRPSSLHPAGVGGHFPDRLDIGRKPCEPMDGVLLGFDLRGVQLPAAVTFSRTAAAASEAFCRILRLSGNVFERHGSSCHLVRRTMRRRAHVAMRLFGRRADLEFARSRLPLCVPPGRMAVKRKVQEANLRRWASIFWNAGEKFLADDGWAIASYIGLTLLTSLFPVPDFRGGAGRLSGLGGACEGGGETRLRRMARSGRGADRAGSVERSDSPRGGLLTWARSLPLISPRARWRR